jgi:FkbM family methyltransferase
MPTAKSYQAGNPPIEEGRTVNPTNEPLLERAQSYLKAGQWADAEQLYQQALAQQPDRTDVLFWLGVITTQLGKPAESVQFYQRALELQPNSGEMHSNLGTVLMQLGQVEEAIAHQQEALRLMPDNAQAHYNLALALYRQGQSAAAAVHYERAIALDPAHANAHHNLGMILFHQGNLDQAIAHYRQAIMLMPNHFNAHNGLGVALYHQGKLDDAIANYRLAIALNPKHVSAYNNLGTALKSQGNVEEARACYEQAIALDPNYANAYDNLGTICQEQKDLDTAISHYRKAIALHPGHANAYCNLGTALKEKGDYEAALACYQEAIRLEPNHPDAYNNCGGTLYELGRYEEAIAYQEQALRYKPDHADAHLNLGIMLLLLGNFQRGFVEYHWRWQTRQCPNLRYPEALWDGSGLTGKILLLTAEQGFGDTIQFARYAPLVKQQYGGEVVLACQKPLLPILSTLQGIDRCVDRDRVDVETNLHAPLLELPRILGTTLETIPATIPYLTANPSLLPLPDHQPSAFNVGIVWSANPNNSTTPKRSCGLDFFLPLLSIPNLVVYSLQKDPSEAEQAQLAQHGIHDLNPFLANFACTAAAIAQLDLVISVDTAVAHLAGALGQPVWTLLPSVADWRWLRDRTDTLWYPTMRLFRQPQARDWAAVSEQIQLALTQMIAGQPISPVAPDPTPSSNPSPSLLPAHSLNQIKPCRYGTFLYNGNDLYVGRSLQDYGEWAEGELALLQPLLRPSDTLVHVGANIGAHTVVLAQAVGKRGKILAIEPQRLLFQMLCANLAINGLTNVHTYPVACGASPGFVQLPLLDARPPNQALTTGTPPATPLEKVQVATLDSFGLSQCRLLKIEMPGESWAILQGATQLLQRCQPILYLRSDRKAHLVPLIRQLNALHYDLFWHPVPLFNPYNLENNKHNSFGDLTLFNLLGLHRDQGISVSGLEPVQLPNNTL